ncbi:hypothetical protein EH223_06125 [candidate division KSB1 bacterium]|nr:hypothetical protein [candidate division KSB1 bacterium]RQW05016.1 MAG: hypothetical protein EH223_06125 [candidate division KSB1 bacterium]
MNSPQHILFVFIDGLGIGPKDMAINPCCFSAHYFCHFLEEFFPKPVDPHGYVVGLDAGLDTPGLPQSATGQTALLTGVNAAKLLNRHLNGFPNHKLRDVIQQHSILKWFVERGYNAAFLNTFRPPFFDYDPHDIINFLSVTSVTNLVAGLPFFGLDDLRNEKSVYQDILGEALRDLNFDVPQFSPEKAGEIIGQEAQNYHFALFEYFQTDRAGHSQDMQRARQLLDILERFLVSVLQHTNLNNTLVLVTSDHGNIEDLSRKSHTRNPVMTLLFGAQAEYVATTIHSILDIYPGITSFFE